MLEQTMNRIGHKAMSAYTRLILNMDVRWHEPLPAGAKIIAANHPTTTDPFYLLALSPEPVSLLITRMAFDTPVFGRLVRMSGHVEVDHKNGRPAFEQALRLLREGWAIGIFPEGGLSQHEVGARRVRSGTARLALLTGAPVIPVGICVDSKRIHYRDTTVDDLFAVARWYPTGPYAMTVGEPMTFSGDVEDRDQVTAVSERIMQRIGTLAWESALRLDGATAHDTSSLPRSMGVSERAVS